MLTKTFKIFLSKYPWHMQKISVLHTEDLHMWYLSEYIDLVETIQKKKIFCCVLSHTSTLGRSGLILAVSDPKRNILLGLSPHFLTLLQLELLSWPADGSRMQKYNQPGRGSRSAIARQGKVKGLTEIGAMQIHPGLRQVTKYYVGQDFSKNYYINFSDVQNKFSWTNNREARFK